MIVVLDDKGDLRIAVTLKSTNEYKHTTNLSESAHPLAAVVKVRRSHLRNRNQEILYRAGGKARTMTRRSSTIMSLV